MQANVNNPSMETPASVNSGVYQTAPSGGCWKNVRLQSDQLTDATRVSQQDSHTMMTDCGVRGREPHGWSQECLFGVHTNLLPFFFMVRLSLTGCRLFFLQEIQDHRQFVDFSSYNNRPAVHLILFVHTCGRSDNFSSLLWALWGRCAVQSDCSDRWSSTCSSLSGLFTLSVRTMQVGRWRLSITISCCLSDFSSSIWDFSSEFNTSNRSDS